MPTSRAPRALPAAVSIAVVLLALLAATFAFATPAQGHGATADPPQRTYLCRYLEPESEMCAEAYRVAPQAVYDWMEVRIADAGGRHRELIPDGELCSAGDPKYAFFDTPTTKWPAAPMAAGPQTFTYTANAPHATLYFRYYLSKQGYDVTQPLRWDDLELIYDSAPLPALPEYDFEIDVPERTGRHIVYVVWQRSDLPEAFYGCSDVDFGDGSGEPNPTPTTTPTQAPQVLTTSSTTTSSWSGGHCADVTVTNPGPRGVSPWQVELPIEGEVTGSWGATITQNGDLATARAESWNATLVAGASTVFGYCASGSAGPNPEPTEPTPTPTEPTPTPTEPTPTPTEPTPTPTEPTPTPTEPTGAIQTSSVTTGDWGSGYCADVSVTNIGPTTVSPWSVDLPLEGTVTSVWNATLEPLGNGKARATGAAYNSALMAGGATSFGYCATRPVSEPVPTPPGEVTAATTVTADWGTGYCASVAVTNPADASVLWQADVPVDGTITALWDAKGIVTEGVLQATGETWNATLAGGGSTDFGYCASR